MAMAIRYAFLGQRATPSMAPTLAKPRASEPTIRIMSPHGTRGSRSLHRQVRDPSGSLAARLPRPLAQPVRACRAGEVGASRARTAGLPVAAGATAASASTTAVATSSVPPRRVARPAVTRLGVPLISRRAREPPGVVRIRKVGHAFGPGCLPIRVEVTEFAG